MPTKPRPLRAPAEVAIDAACHMGDVFGVDAFDGMIGELVLWTEPQLNLLFPPEPVLVVENQYLAVPTAVARAVWTKHGDACVYCGDPATVLDHLVPRVKGGTNAAVNLRPACEECNRQKLHHVHGWAPGSNRRDRQGEQLVCCCRPRRTAGLVRI